MKKLFKWFFMLSKRLYKKPSFLVLLLLIPLCIVVFSFVAKQNSGFVHIVLAQTNGGDETSSQIIQKLLNENSLIRFTAVTSEQEAFAQVESGSADEAWVFASNTGEILECFPNKTQAVSIFTKKQNTAVRLAREKLTGVLYTYCSKAYFVNYVRTNFEQLNNLSDQQISSYFEKARVDERLFIHKAPQYLSGGESNSHYLTSPLRGLLAVLAVLCGLSATMYYKQDDKNGTFSYVRSNRKGSVAFGCVITAIIHIVVAIWISLCISSLAVNVFLELLILLIYAVCCASFCLLLETIFSDLHVYVTLIPLLTVVCIGICPVFFDFRNLYIVQMLFPPTYYINAIYNQKYLFYMALYSVACLALSYILKVIKGFYPFLKKQRVSQSI